MATEIDDERPVVPMPFTSSDSSKPHTQKQSSPTISQDISSTKGTTPSSPTDSLSFASEHIVEPLSIPN